MSERRFLGVGDTLPDMVLPDLTGTPVNLRRFSGRRVILFMWASW